MIRSGFEKITGYETSFSFKEFSDFKYGYAITANKSQGMTVDRSFNLIDSRLTDREKFYVMRSRDRAQIFSNMQSIGELS
jgi:ATP-dependent exoDNAse (exonuclease V) alpha subunit